MNNHLIYEGKRDVLTFTGELTIRQAEELRAVLTRALAGAETVSMDFVGVTAADLSFLELLCSAHRSAMRLNKRLTFGSALPECIGQTVAKAGFARRTCCFSRHSDCNPACEKGCLWIVR